MYPGSRAATRAEKMIDTLRARLRLHLAAHMRRAPLDEIDKALRDVSPERKEPLEGDDELGRDR